MAKTKTKKTIQHHYRWTVSELAEVCNLSESYLYRLVREYRLFRDADDGAIDGVLNRYNVGMLVQILPPKLNAEYIEFVRKVYHLGPAPEMPEGAGFPE